MAKNWKRAHDILKQDNDVLRVTLGDVQSDLDEMLSVNAMLERNLALACGHMEAASDQFQARAVVSTATLLRSEARRLGSPLRNGVAPRTRLPVHPKT